MSQVGGHRGAPEPAAANHAGETSETTPGVQSEECELCGGAMYGLHCKLICANCGYRRDCSDP